MDKSVKNIICGSLVMCIIFFLSACLAIKCFISEVDNKSYNYNMICDVVSGKLSCKITQEKQDWEQHANKIV